MILLITNPQFVNLILQLGGSNGLADSYFTMVLAFLGEIFAVYAILATLKMHSQESKKYSEMVLTSSVSRSQWAVSNLIFAVLGPALVIIIFALTYGLTYGLSADNLFDSLPRILEASLVYLPAVWFFTGISMLLFGLMPRLAALSWMTLGIIVIIDLLGEFFDISQWIKDISPFTHIPRLLVGDTAGNSLILLLVISFTLILIGIWGYKRRDING